jgi:hypothetical protein
MKEHYTYAYLREDRTPYYIGKGKGNRAYMRRKNDIKPPKDKSRIILLKQNLTEEEAFKHEIYMIAVYGRKDLGTGILYNQTNGGQGSSGRIMSEKERQHLSEIKKGKKPYDITEETRKKMSNSQRNRTCTEDTKRKISLSHKGKPKPPLSKEHKEKITNSLLKKIYKVKCPNGEVVEIKNLKKFCRDNNLADSHIRNKKRNYTTKGFTLLETARC